MVKHFSYNTASCIIMMSANKFELLENVSRTLNVSCVWPLKNAYSFTLPTWGNNLHRVTL